MKQSSLIEFACDTSSNGDKNIYRRLADIVASAGTTEEGRIRLNDFLTTFGFQQLLQYAESYRRTINTTDDDLVQHRMENPQAWLRKRLSQVNNYYPFDIRAVYDRVQDLHTRYCDIMNMSYSSYGDTLKVIGLLNSVPTTTVEPLSEQAGDLINAWEELAYRNSEMVLNHD